MIKTTEPRLKANQRERAQAEFTKLLSAAESQGFYGTASITVSVQDGHIQHVRVAVERMVK